ncbi:helix-turn-helix domain-containing protein [Emcibacter nanhaiensis]|uniref:Helix-turn-helix transcriptional regulator n=1 Tax=Emcibacter nanhaiensis TaxID=1505037 RepID=A0A501P9Z5_9PROT|nr:helix-turn-helix domain-containing protein [Emcibacter nanhaiensis]TPD56837.1 helix-turn-helix transcriptional regulator [Emcibacter nanhaiensis]
MEQPQAVRNEQQLGALIRIARKNKGWRQVDLARQASMRQQLISDLENGASSSRLDTILKVLAALDLDLSITGRQAPSFDPQDY